MITIKKINKRIHERLLDQYESDWNSRDLHIAYFKDPNHPNRMQIHVWLNMVIDGDPDTDYEVTLDWYS